MLLVSVTTTIQVDHPNRLLAIVFHTTLGQELCFFLSFKLQASMVNIFSLWSKAAKTLAVAKIVFLAVSLLSATFSKGLKENSCM